MSKKRHDSEKRVDGQAASCESPKSLSSCDVRQFRSDKILNHVDRVADFFAGKNPPPVTVELDMTNVCNHRCQECVVDYYQVNDNNSLPRTVAERIIDEIAEAGTRGLIFTGGGEPLCHPDTLDMVVRARSRGMDIGFITNGQLLDERACEIIVQNCVWTRVSLDASNAEMFTKTHGVKPVVFDKVHSNIRTLAAAKRRLNATCTVGVGYLTSGVTVGGLEAATLLCKEAGVDYLQFRPMQIHHGGKFVYDWEVVDEEIERSLSHATPTFSVLFSKHKYEMMRRADYGRDYKACYGQQFATVISATGKMYLCCHLRGYEKYCLGDLKEQSFAEIWGSEQRRKAYEAIDFADCIPLCRCNTFNQILWDMAQPKEHLNFL